MAGEVFQHSHRKGLDSRFFGWIGEEIKTEAHDASMKAFRNGYFLEQSQTVAFNRVMKPRLFEVPGKRSKMFADQPGMVLDDITQRPGCSLFHYRVPVKKNCIELIKPLLAAANPVDDLCYLGFRVFSEYGVQQFHGPNLRAKFTI